MNILTSKQAQVLFESTMKSHNVENMSYDEAEAFQKEMYGALTGKVNNEVQTQVLQALNVEVAHRKAELAGSSSPNDLMRQSPEQMESNHNNALRQAQVNLDQVSQSGNEANVEEATRILHGLTNVERARNGLEQEPYFSNDEQGKREQASYIANGARVKVIGQKE